MTSLDVLFWLMILLLGGVAWAIEAGLTVRHRRVLMASTLSAFSALVFVMFWIEDESSIQLGDKVVFKPGGKEPAEKTAEEEEESGGGGGGGSGGAGTKSGRAAEPNPAAKAQPSNAAPNEPPVSEKKPVEPKAPPEYSTEPFRDCLLCPELVIITPRDGGDVGKPFAVGRLQILRKEFASFVQSAGYTAAENCDIQSTRKGKYSWRNPGFEQDGRHPVVCVTPQDADAYIDWISRRTDRGYRLLSETEWDYAARAGTDTPYWQGATIEPSQANFGRFRDGTIAGGSLPANRFGLSDMNGNVWQILGGCDVGTACAERILKGGAWNSTAEQLRISTRLSLPATSSTNFIGFRVARDIDKRDANKILSKAKKAALAADDKAAAAIEAKERVAAEKAEFDRLEAAAKAANAPPPKK